MGVRRRRDRRAPWRRGHPRPSADGGVAQRGGELAHAAQRQRAQQPGAAVDVVVERRGAHAQLAGHPRQRDGVEALGVRDRGRGVDHALGVEPGAAASARRRLGDRRVHRGRRRLDDPPVAGRQRGRLQRAQGAGALELGRAVPGGQPASGKGRRTLSVVATPPSVVYASPQSSVPSRRSKKATCPGVWPGAATTSSEPTRSPGRRASASAASWPPGSCRAAWPAARRGRATCPCAAGARRAREMRTSTPGSAAASVVERADVVAVGVGQRDADDRRAELLGGRAGRLGAARDQRVDEREPVVLGDEVGVDEAEAGDASQVSGHRS